MYSNSYNNFSGENKELKELSGVTMHKRTIKYSRNYEIDDINTYKLHNPYMPYKDQKYDERIL